jgi:pimeloyl-ACP methyl ester carboxylesterase
MPTKFINGKSLYYTTDGPAESARDTLVLIHGLGSSSSYYRPVIPYLNSNIRCIAIDTPGSGLSSLGESEQTIDSIVEDIINLLDALDINTEITIVGHSMGGIVASAMAANHKSRVKGVVLIGPVNPSPAFSQVFDERIGRVKKGMLAVFKKYIALTSQTALKPWPSPFQWWQLESPLLHYITHSSGI